MPRKFLFVITLLCCNSLLFAQNSNLAPNIALATELKEKYKDADAVCLKSENLITIRFEKSTKSYSAVLTCTEEYIFLKKNFEFRLPVLYDENSKIVNIKAFNQYAYISDELGHSNEIFHDDTRYKLFKFHVGSFGQKLKIQYEKVYYDLHYLTSFYFEGDKYPCVEKNLKLQIQSTAIIDIVEKNFENNQMEKSFNKDSYDGTKNYFYTIKDAEAYNSDDNTPHSSQLYAHIIFLVKKIELLSKPPQKYFETTDDLYHWYNDLVKKAISDNDKTTLTPIVNELIQGKTEIEKMKAIYYWVQDKIRYIAFENGISGYMPDSACVVFNKKYGDCKGMANLLVQMLKIAGFDAHHTWIGTRGISYDYTTPILLINNHMICTVYYNDKIYFLDATEKCSAFGEIAERIQGRDALIENGDTYIIKKTPAKNIVENNIIKKTTIRINDQKLEGNSSINFSGESRAKVLHVLNYSKSSNIDENITNYLTDNNSNFKVSDVSHSALNNFEGDFNLSYNFSISNRVQAFNNEFYVNFDFYEEYLGSKMDTSRKYDYLLTNKEGIIHETEFIIPNNYTVSYIPENISINNEDFIIKVTFKKEANKVLYNKTISFPNAKISKKNFEEWNKSMKKLRELYNNQLVLKN